MEYRRFISLTDEEIIEVVTDMFKPTKIENICRNDDLTISLDIETDWDNGNSKDFIWDTVILANPFQYGSDAIRIEQWDTTAGQYLTFEQFCFAKHIVNPNWIENNPYLKEK